MYLIWLGKHPYAQTYKTSALSDLRDLLSQEQFSRSWLSQFASGHTKFLSLVNVDLSGIPEMMDYSCWRVELHLETAPPASPHRILGDISAYDLGDSWAIVCENLGTFPELFSSYAADVIQAMAPHASWESMHSLGDDVRIQDSEVLIRVGEPAMDSLRIQASRKPVLLKDIEELLKEFDEAWMRAQTERASYFEYRIGLEHSFFFRPQPEMPAVAYVGETQASWPLFYRNRYNQVSYLCGAYLGVELHSGRRGHIIFKGTDQAGWVATLPFIARIMLALSEHSLIDLTSARAPLVEPAPANRAFCIPCELGQFQKTVQQFANERLWRHGWGKRNLQLSFKRAETDASIFPFALWSILSSNKNDPREPERCIGQIAAAALTHQDLVVELTAEATERATFAECVAELQDYMIRQGIDFHPLATITRQRVTRNLITPSQKTAQSSQTAENQPSADSNPAAAVQHEPPSSSLGLITPEKSDQQTGKMIAKAPTIETTNPHISVSELVQQTNITILIQEQVKSAEPQVPVKVPEQSQQASPTPEQSVQSASKDVENNPASGDANQAKSSKPGRKTRYSPETIYKVVKEWEGLQKKRGKGLPAIWDDDDNDSQLVEADGDKNLVEFLIDKFGQKDNGDPKVAPRTFQQWMKNFRDGKWKIPKATRKKGKRKNSA